MTTVIIILFALICIFIVGASWCCLKVGADADKYSIGEKRKITSKCEKCGTAFEWTKDDALVKYKYDYGNKYIIGCPCCKKLIRFIEIP